MYRNLRWASPAGGLLVCFAAVTLLDEINQPIWEHRLQHAVNVCVHMIVAVAIYFGGY